MKILQTWSVLKSGIIGLCFDNEVFSQAPGHEHFLAPFGDFKFANLLNFSCGHISGG